MGQQVRAAAGLCPWPPTTGARAQPWPRPASLASPARLAAGAAAKHFVPPPRRWPGANDRNTCHTPSLAAAQAEKPRVRGQAQPTGFVGLMSGPNLPPRVGTAEHRAMLGGGQEGAIGTPKAVAGKPKTPRDVAQDARLTNAEFEMMRQFGPKRCTHKIGDELIVNAPVSSHSQANPPSPSPFALGLRVKWVEPDRSLVSPGLRRRDPSAGRQGDRRGARPRSAADVHRQVPRKGRRKFDRLLGMSSLCWWFMGRF